MEALLEKTFLKVNVLLLEVRVDPLTAASLEALRTAHAPEPAPPDSLVSVILRAPDAWARIRFRRGASLGQFLGGIRRNLDAARRAGIIDAAYRDEVSANLPRWFAFLEDRGVRTGDALLYRIHGDTLRTVYQDASGTVHLDQTDPEPRSRFAILGSYFAPGSDFRARLLQSLRHP
jgi:hypothetical protein